MQGSETERAAPFFGLDRPSLGGTARCCALLTLLCFAHPAKAQDRDNCLLCHKYRGLSRVSPETGQLHLFHVDPEYTRGLRGPHARLACTDCHDAASVNVIPHQEVRRVDCTRTCHLVNPDEPERRFSHANVGEMLDRSIHTGRILNSLALSEGPAIADGQSVCLYCHDEPIFREPAGAISGLPALPERRFDRCDVCHVQQVPVDTAYYLRHIASRLQPLRPTLELAQVCALCHSDPALRKLHGLRETVGSYLRSFHGKAALLGDESTANCISCHVGTGQNAHLMLAAEDPRSSVNPARIANSCRSTACHPGADPAIGAAAVHLDLPSAGATLEFAIAAAFIVITILTFGPSALIVVLELLHLLIRSSPRGRSPLVERVVALMSHPAARRTLTRFTFSQRIQHWVLAILFTLLALTGFPMKFADRGWSQTVIHAFGGLGTARIVHHWGGIALVLGFIGHMVYAACGLVRRARASARLGERGGVLAGIYSLPMWLSLEDGRKALQLLGHLLFLRTRTPTFGRFSVKEKFEYIGVFWGTALLGITGAMLWGAQMWSHFLGGRILTIAAIAHTYEAFLAVIHVGILHIVNVIFSPNVFPLSLAMITGQTPAPELAAGHSELVLQAARDAGIEPQPGDAHG